MKDIWNAIKQNRGLQILLVLECVVLALFFARFVACALHQSGSFQNIELESFLSDRAQYTDAGWYMDSEINGGTGEGSEMLYGPYLKLPRGSYEAVIRYDASAEGMHEHSASVESVHHSEWLNADPEIVLYKNLHDVTIPFEVVHYTDDLEVSVSYVGDGSLLIRDISYRRTAAMEGREFCYALFLILFLNVCLYLRKGKEELRTAFLWIVGVSFLGCLPLGIGGLSLQLGQDLEFHLLQIEGIFSGLKAGMFPVRIQPSWIAGYGYPLSVCYGDLFLYFPALLRFIGFSLTDAYKIFVLGITCLTAILSYRAFTRVSGSNHMIALLGMTAYVLAPYRLTDIYLRAAVGEYIAIAFLPLVFAGLYDLYFADDSRDGVVSIILGMTGLLQSHVLTSLLAVMFIALFAILCIHKTFTKHIFAALILAVVGTVLLNIWLLLPMLDYLLHVDMQITSLVQNEYGVVCPTEIPYYFLAYRNMFTSGIKILPGLLLLCGLFVWMFFRKGQKSSGNIFGVMSILGLFATSVFFPWDYILRIPYVGMIFRPIQFAFRFMAPTQCCMAFLLCFMLADIFKHDKGMQETQGSNDSRQVLAKHMVVGFFILYAVFFMSMLTGDYEAQEPNFAPSGLSALDSRHCMGGQFLRADCDKYALDGTLYSEGTTVMEELDREPLFERLHVETGEREATVDVPFLHYKGYRAYDQNGNEFAVSDGREKTVRVNLPKEYEGDIVICWVEPITWRMAELVSIVAIIAFAFMARRSKTDKRNS